MADVTNKETRVPGVNQDTNFVKQEANMVDAAGLGVTAVGTHDLFKLPAGVMLTGFRAAVLDEAVGSGATIQFKAAMNGSSVNLTSATAVSALGSGATINVPVADANGYDAVGSGAIIQMAVGTSALTSFKALAITEYIPVKDYLERG